MATLSARDVIFTLDMERHPEGGWYAETYRDPDEVDGRAVSSAIYYLLEAGELSAWHRVDAAEVWHFYAGDPLELSVSEGESSRALLLGQDLAAGQRPQAVVPKGYWQSARTLGQFTLVGCTVAPGFRFSGFELAPIGWRPRG